MKYYAEKGSGYEFGVEGEKLYITKSPKRKSTSRKNKQEIKQGTKAYNAIKNFATKAGHVFDMSSETSGANDDKSTKEKKNDSDPSKSNSKNVNQANTVKTDQANNTRNASKSKTSSQDSKDKEDKFKNLTKKSFKDFKEITWLDGEQDFIEGIAFNDKKYFSYGYAEDINTGKKGIACTMTYNDARDIYKASGKSLTPVMGGIKTIKPKRGTFKIDWKKEKGAKNVYIVPWGSNGVDILVDSGDYLDGATIAAKSQILLDFLGGIPILGTPADFGNLMVELMKPNPSYFYASMCALGAIPGIGEAMVLLKASKALPKVAAKMSAKEGALKFAQKFSKMDSLQDIGSTLRGSSMTKKLVNAQETTKTLITKHHHHLEKIGVKLKEETVEKFIKYFDQFCKWYKYYMQMRHVKFLGKVKNYYAVAERPLSYIGAETIGKSLGDELASIDAYKLTGVQKTDNVFKDSIKIAKVISEKSLGDNPSEEIVAANIKLFNYLEGESFQKFLDSKPDVNKKITAENRIITETTLKKIIKQKLLVTR
jgi:hypothetical protein